jgi:hypothetical protein
MLRQQRADMIWKLSVLSSGSTLLRPGQREKEPEWFCDEFV